MTDPRNDASPFDTRLTFDTFVVGPANRLASAAARRAAESPGSGYNPLFLYSASGLGKSHILSAIAYQSLRVKPERHVVYQTLEGYLDDLTRVLEGSEDRAARDRYETAEVLLLDDVQFLTGQTQAQEMLLRTLDSLTSRGAQVVLASDRPPADINGLDARLLSRFSGGLIVDIGLPDYETRVAIMHRKVEDRGSRLADGVAEGLARFPFRNVRELQGALNRLLAVQELEDRLVPLEGLGSVLGERFLGVVREGLAAGEEQGASTEGEAEWRRAFREVIGAVEGAGYSARRLRDPLDGKGREPDDWRDALQRFRRDIDRLREIAGEIVSLAGEPEGDARTILRDPDRLEEAERLLQMARERNRPFPPLPDGPALSATGDRFPALAKKAAARVLTDDPPAYLPLYLHAAEPVRGKHFLESCGREFILLRPEARIGLSSVPEFAEEFIRALAGGVAVAWRERWSAVDLLLLSGIERLHVTERAQEEFFHLFEALKRRGARILLSADRSASDLEGLDERLRSRFEGGLVLDLGPEPMGSEWDTEDPNPADAVVERVAASGSGVRSTTSEWKPLPERMVWRWPRLDDRIVEEES